MGFYLRKGINLGPLRLNLSRSGVGASFGVKGARIGIGPRGRYVHVGRAGLYYRKSLGRGGPLLAPAPAAGPPGLAALETPVAPPSATDLSRLVDSSSADLLAELERSHHATAWFPMVFTAVAIAAVVVGLRFPDWRVLAGLPVAAALLVLVYRSDAKRCVTELHYHLDPPVEQAYARLGEAFAGLAACAGRWHAAAEAAVADPRALAGASASIEPVPIAPLRELPARVRCNLEPPALHAGDRTLYLFPDRVVVFQGAAWTRSAGAICGSNPRPRASSSSARRPRTPGSWTTSGSIPTRTGAPTGGSTTTLSCRSWSTASCGSRAAADSGSASCSRGPRP